jgi:hypothetical protein
MRSLFIALLLTGGCHIGPRLDTYAPAHSPVGTMADIRTTEGTRVKGELLSVSADGFFVAADGRIAWIGSSAVKRARFTHTSQRIFAAHSRVPDKVVAAVRPRSRFPAGIPVDVLERLLAVHGQMEPDSILARTPR